MALAPRRHAEVDAMLQDIHQYLTELAAEIDAADLFINEQRQLSHRAMKLAAEITLLRQALQDAQEQQRLG